MGEEVFWIEHTRERAGFGKCIWCPVPIKPDGTVNQGGRTSGWDFPKEMENGQTVIHISHDIGFVGISHIETIYTNISRDELKTKLEEFYGKDDTTWPKTFDDWLKSKEFHYVCLKSYVVFDHAIRKSDMYRSLQVMTE